MVKDALENQNFKPEPQAPGLIERIMGFSNSD